LVEETPVPDVEEAAPAPKRRRTRKKPEELPLSGILQQREEPTTEAGRDQLRYALRDARKRIGWVDESEALKEASRIEHEQRVDVAHAAALEGEGDGGGEGPDADQVSARLGAEEARRADVLARLQAAEAAIEMEGQERRDAGIPEGVPAGAAPPEQAAAAGEGPLIAPDQEARILRAMRLRDRVSRLVAGLDLNDLADFEAILSRLEYDHELRHITAALIKALAGQDEPALGQATALESPSEPKVSVSAPSSGADDEGRGARADEMTRLFISIGRRAHVNRESLERLVRETAQIDGDDIGRIDLLHNFAFIEVRKTVASRVIEGMHETMFKGREISVEPAKSSAKEE